MTSEYGCREYCKLSSSYDPDEYERRHATRFPASLNKHPDKRSRFEGDRDRIIHCAAFRRMQGKSQVFGMGGSDFFRTRLTHSLEAAQIGKGIVIQCGEANMELVEAACLAHDIGHPPFGHTGENVLKELMSEYGGFEANAQNLRILTELEVRSSCQLGPGLNLTRATTDALLKYKTPYSDVNRNEPIENWKFFYGSDNELIEWASLNAPTDKARSFECEIMNWADDVAYSTHDLDDGIKAGMISENKIDSRIEQNVRERMKDAWSQKVWDEVLERVRQASPRLGTAYDKKAKRRDLIIGLIDEFIQATRAKKRTGKSFPSRYQYELEIEQDKEVKCKILKSLVWELIITDERIATLRRKAETIIRSLFEEFTRFDDEERTRNMYPLDFRERFDSANNQKEKYRIACDYIAGMTDSYATRLYARLTNGETGSLFEII